MKFTPYAAFGTVVIVTSTEIGDTHRVILGDNGLVTSGYYYYTLGRAEVTHVETGEKLEDRTPGWLNSEHDLSSASIGGEITLTFPEKTEWSCISHKSNPIGLPNLTSLLIKNGEETIIPNGTNLFLARGTLQINDTIFTGPRQIRIRSGDVTATAIITGDCYSLIFS